MSKTLAPKKHRILLTGEKVPELTVRYVLQAIQASCPAKWAFVDLETGDIYGWDPERKAWVHPPYKAHLSLKKAVTDMRRKAQRTAKRKSTSGRV